MIKRYLKGRTFLIQAMIIVIFIICYLVAPHTFNKGNIMQILNNLSFIGVMAVGVACLQLSGGIDFAASAHSVMGMVIFASFVEKYPSIPWIIPGILYLIFGAFAGLINAFFTERMRLMSFIVTVGMQSVWKGIALWVVKGNIITLTRSSFNNLATKYIGSSPIPVLFCFMVLMYIIYGFILKWTRLGRSAVMVGGNPAAARLAGLHPSKIRTIAFVNCGVLAAVSGLIWASQQKMASPTGLTASTPEMTALTASILGGVSFAGGSGSLVGAFFGVVLINVLSYALQAMGTPLWLLTLINGSLLLIALTIDSLNNRKSRSGAGMGMPGMAK